jgi:hypothetical protein
MHVKKFQASGAYKLNHNYNYVHYNYVQSNKTSLDQKNQTKLPP